MKTQKMQFYPIAPIKDFVLNEHTNNLYKQVANSSIDLAKKCAEKINEVISAFNELGKEKWEKIHEQDGKIRSAILYMKDNLLNTIKILLDSKGEEMMDNAVKEYLGSLKEELNHLESRLDNLLGSVTEGSTTMDAEIIDGRVGFDGKVYTSLGDAIRSQHHFMTRIHSGNYQEKLPDLNNATSPRYLLNFATTDTNLPLNMPFDLLPEPIVLLETYNNDNYTIQRLTTKGKIYTRFKGGSTWSNWNTDNYIKTIIQSSNYQNVLPNLDNATEREYLLLFATGTKTENLPLHMPINEVLNPIGVLKTYNLNGYKWQEYLSGGKVYTRFATGSNWSNWNSSDEVTYVTIKADNYLNKLPDVNECDINKIYVLNFANGTKDIPSNLPFESIPDSLLFIRTYKSQSYGYQEIIPANNKYLYRRMFAGSWNDWFMVYGNTSDGETSLTINTSTGILKGLKECYSSGIKKLYVESGTYDVIKEYEEYYGSDYFTNYVSYSTSEFDRGLWLEDIEIVFSPGAKVVCNYTGSNQAVKDYFSPFSIGNNVIINGLVLDSSNCRYGLHPDFNTGSNRSYMKILNSDLKHYKSSSNEQCIGAGFGVHVDWLIENTIFRSENNTHVFRVHNNVSEDAQSKLIIKDCYIEGPGYFKFNHYSTSEKESTILVSGCSYVNEPQVAYETADSTIPNMKLIKFNNEKRDS